MGSKLTTRIDHSSGRRDLRKRVRSRVAARGIRKLREQTPAIRRSGTRSIYHHSRTHNKKYRDISEYSAELGRPVLTQDIVNQRQILTEAGFTASSDHKKFYAAARLRNAQKFYGYSSSMFNRINPDLLVTEYKNMAQEYRQQLKSLCVQVNKKYIRDQKQARMRVSSTGSPFKSLVSSARYNYYKQPAIHGRIRVKRPRGPGVLNRVVEAFVPVASKKTAFKSFMEVERQNYWDLLLYQKTLLELYRKNELISERHNFFRDRDNRLTTEYDANLQELKSRLKGNYYLLSTNYWHQHALSFYREVKEAYLFYLYKRYGDRSTVFRVFLSNYRRLDEPPFSEAYEFYVSQRKNAAVKGRGGFRTWVRRRVQGGLGELPSKSRPLRYRVNRRRNGTRNKYVRSGGIRRRARSKKKFWLLKRITSATFRLVRGLPYNLLPRRVRQAYTYSAVNTTLLRGSPGYHRGLGYPLTSKKRRAKAAKYWARVTQDKSMSHKHLLRGLRKFYWTPEKYSLYRQRKNRYMRRLRRERLFHKSHKSRRRVSSRGFKAKNSRRFIYRGRVHERYLKNNTIVRFVPMPAEDRRLLADKALQDTLLAKSRETRVVSKRRQNRHFLRYISRERRKAL